MRQLIIDGNAVYEIDEKCMLRKQITDGEEKKKTEETQQKKEK